MSNTPIIRIVKKKAGHGGHHGGAWKVAYADFVTAMMAFFLVMWIIAMDQPTRIKIQSYFTDPASSTHAPAGISQLSTGGKNPTNDGFTGIMTGKNTQEAQKQRFLQVQKALQGAFATRPDLSRLAKHAQIGVSASGLTITLVEAGDALFFESGSARVPEASRKLLTLIGHELGHLANPIAIEGHTDAVPYQGNRAYSNWELSADRANATRRVLQSSGVRPNQIVEVRGCAATRLADPQHPTAAANRRVAILVTYVDSKPASADGGKKGRGTPLPFSLNIKPGSLSGTQRASTD
jgi:chemotaxis protein MotB